MILQNNKTTNPNVLAYFLTRTMFIGGGISLMFATSQKDTYIATIFGYLIGIIIIYLICLVSKKVTIPFNEYLKKKSITNYLLRLIYLVYIIFIIFIILIILATFLYSYFLPFTPSFISCIPFVILAFYLTKKGNNTLYYLANILLVFSILIVISKTLLLANEFTLSNILPIYSISTQNIFSSSITYALVSTTPMLLLIDEDISFRQMGKYYSFGSLAIFLIIISITFILGNAVTVYSFPSYSILRKINFFNFIENIENFISVSWFFDLFITLAIAIKKLKKIIPSQKDICPFILLVIILLIVNKYVANNFYYNIFFYKYFQYIFLTFSITIIFLISIKKK